MNHLSSVNREEQIREEVNQDSLDLAHCNEMQPETIQTPIASIQKEQDSDPVVGEFDPYFQLLLST